MGLREHLSAEANTKALGSLNYTVGVYKGQRERVRCFISRVILTIIFMFYEDIAKNFVRCVNTYKPHSDVLALTMRITKRLSRDSMEQIVSNGFLVSFKCI